MSKKKTKSKPLYMKINTLVLQIREGHVNLENIDTEKLEQMEKSLFEEIAYEEPDYFDFEPLDNHGGVFEHKKHGHISFMAFGPMYRTRYGYYMPVIMAIGSELARRKKMIRPTIETVLDAEKDSPMFKNIGELWYGYVCIKNELPSVSQEIVPYLREITASSAKITPQMRVSFRYAAFPIESAEDIPINNTYYQISIFDEKDFMLYELDIVDNGEFHLKKLKANYDLMTVKHSNDWNEIINYLKEDRDDN